MSAHKRFSIPLADDRTLELGPSPIIMGILNVTPDSFSDGGAHETPQNALTQTRNMIAEGADIIDIGGESTRPGADEISVQDELDRVIPVFEAITKASLKTYLSIDTYKALIADQALQSGAHIINDVYGLQREPEIADVAALHKAPVIIMHWDATRDTTKDIIAEMTRYFDTSRAIASKAGIPDNQIILDPGFGFGKNLSENYEILRRLDELHTLGLPLLAGTSRKSMIGKLLNVPTEERIAGTIATNVLAYNAGAHVFRVHDVREHHDALRIAHATQYGPPQET